MLKCCVEGTGQPCTCNQLSDSREKNRRLREALHACCDLLFAAWDDDEERSTSKGEQ